MPGLQREAQGTSEAMPQRVHWGSMEMFRRKMLRAPAQSLSMQSPHWSQRKTLAPPRFTFL